MKTADKRNWMIEAISKMIDHFLLHKKSDSDDLFS